MWRSEPVNADGCASEGGNRMEERSRTTCTSLTLNPVSASSFAVIDHYIGAKTPRSRRWERTQLKLERRMKWISFGLAMFLLNVVVLYSLHFFHDPKFQVITSFRTALFPVDTNQMELWTHQTLRTTWQARWTKGVSLTERWEVQPGAGLSVFLNVSREDWQLPTAASNFRFV